MSKRPGIDRVVSKPGTTPGIVPEKVDVSSPTANMYGCQPCPCCGSRYRYPMQDPDGIFIHCDDCDPPTRNHAEILS
jgi:hypothetical protein